MTPAELRDVMLDLAAACLDHEVVSWQATTESTNVPGPRDGVDGDLQVYVSRTPNALFPRRELATRTVGRACMHPGPLYIYDGYETERPIICIVEEALLSSRLLRVEWSG